MTLNSGGVANIHGCFRLIPAVVLLPLAGVFEKIAMKLIKDDPQAEEDKSAIAALNALDERFFATPALALDQVERVVLEMSAIAIHNFEACVAQLYEYDPKRDQRIQERENLLDSMTDAANKYIVNLSSHVTRDDDTRHQNALLKALICYERIGDLAVNIADEVGQLQAGGKKFSSNAMAELKIAFDAVSEILDITTTSYQYKNSVLAGLVEPLEEVIDDLVADMNARHVYRMVNQLCDAVNGIYYQAILTNIEHISDKCSDIAVYILEWDNQDIFGREHSYVHDLHHSNDQKYMDAYNKDREKYISALQEISITDRIEEPEDEEADSPDEESESRRKAKDNSRDKVKEKSLDKLKDRFRAGQADKNAAEESAVTEEA